MRNDKEIIIGKSKMENVTFLSGSLKKLTNMHL